MLLLTTQMPVPRTPRWVAPVVSSAGQAAAVNTPPRRAGWCGPRSIAVDRIRGQAIPESVAGRSGEWPETRSVRTPSPPKARSPACKLIATAVQLRIDLRDYLNRPRAVDGASVHGVDTKPGVETPRFVQCPRCRQETAADSTFCERCAAPLRQLRHASARTAGGPSPQRPQARRRPRVPSRGWAHPRSPPRAGTGESAGISRSCSATSSTRRRWRSVSIPRT